MALRLKGEAFGIYVYPITIGVVCAPVGVTTGVATGGTNTDTRVLHAVVYLGIDTLCHLQPFPTKISALHPGFFNSQMI